METAVALTSYRGSFWPRIIRSTEITRCGQEIVRNLDGKQVDTIQEIFCDLLIQAVVREGTLDICEVQHGQDQAEAS